MAIEDLVEAIDLGGYEVESVVVIRDALITRDIPVFGEEDAACALLTINKKTEAGESVREVLYLYSSKQTPLAVRRDVAGSLV